MKVVLQRVSEAAVRVDGKVVGEIAGGLLALVGIADGDGDQELKWMAEKVAGLRIFSDADGKMNLSVSQQGGSILAVSQFTLLADTRKGKRPSFVTAAAPEPAEKMFDDFCAKLRSFDIRVETGVFGADMKVSLINDGPVTIPLETQRQS